LAAPARIRRQHDWQCRSTRGGIIREISAKGLLVIHILLAIAVTVHVLLHKRDVGASIGWIGLAWLSPILGSILYVILGINRVKRRANLLRDKRPDRHAAERLFRRRGAMIIWPRWSGPETE
jgi:hypothetical protein